jgi:hypothetical protein
MTILEKVKIYLDISDTSRDELLASMIEDAQAYVVEFCGFSDTTEIPATLDATIAKMVITDYNKRGAEGLNSESYAGASYNYESDYPISVKNALYRERLCGVQ